MLHLDDVLVRRTNHPDDYVADEELVLKGHGTTYTEEGNVPLPQDAYEIPLLGDITIQQEQDGLKVHTDRAVYTIGPGKSNKKEKTPLIQGVFLLVFFFRISVEHRECAKHNA